jgi:hypothetical protein
MITNLQLIFNQILCLSKTSNKLLSLLTTQLAYSGFLNYMCEFKLLFLVM